MDNQTSNFDTLIRSLSISNEGQIKNDAEKNGKGEKVLHRKSISVIKLKKKSL